MIVEKRPSGLMVPVSPPPPKSPPHPAKCPERRYFTSQYGDIGCIMRMLELIKADGAELVSIVRHGPPGSGIVLDSCKNGYVITYIGDKQLGTWEKT